MLRGCAGMGKNTQSRAWEPPRQTCPSQALGLELGNTLSSDLDRASPGVPEVNRLREPAYLQGNPKPSPFIHPRAGPVHKDVLDFVRQDARDFSKRLRGVTHATSTCSGIRPWRPSYNRHVETWSTRYFVTALDKQRTSDSSKTLAAHRKTEIMAREKHPYNPFSVRIQHLGI